MVQSELYKSTSMINASLRKEDIRGEDGKPIKKIKQLFLTKENFPIEMIGYYNMLHHVTRAMGKCICAK